MEAAMEQNLEPERIASDKEAVAAGATLCQNEWMMFLQGLISTNQMVAEAVHAQMNAIMAHREESGQDHASLSAAMTRVNQNLELAEIMRQQLIQEAEEKTQEALASIEAAQQALEWDDPDLQHAREKIKEQTEPFARGAVDALRLIHGLLPGFANDLRLRKRFHLLLRIVRDLVMLRCLTGCQDPKDRDGFLVIAYQAYEGDLNTEARAQLLLAYHKNKTNQKHGFISNNQVATERRGGPRRRKRDNKKGQAGSGACSSHEQPSYEQPEGDDEFIDVGDGGVMSSCCAAAADEPMFLPLPEGYQESDPMFLPLPELYVESDGTDIFGSGFSLVPSDVLVASGWTLEEQEAMDLQYWAQSHQL